jgi:paired amphipathic helix protein Sin3a
LDKEHIPSQQEIYEEYIASYIDWMHDTKGVDRSLLKPSFLNRNLVKSVVKRPSTFVKPQLRYKVHEASYHMYYIVGSEDVYYRQSNSKEREDEANSENSGSRWQELISANDNLTGDALLNYQ